MKKSLPCLCVILATLAAPAAPSGYRPKVLPLEPPSTGEFVAVVEIFGERGPGNGILRNDIRSFVQGPYGVAVAFAEKSAGPGPRQKAKPTSPANSNKNCGVMEGGSPSSSNPVVLATGEKHLSELDIPSGGEYGLGVHRTYRSIHASGSMFGAHWLASIDFPRLAFYLRQLHQHTERRLHTRIRDLHG
ncbi:DUF6531 domain-containing protein [Pseudoduganella namucuonensis]|uniref:DUF6531 domain-containing protein n=1 Tax=Pseudoduganella namucuonensis TaxID=1035707 RepID=UPI0011602A4F|nr:DUF6531 domain-containing protein [Pseudoduganella namucuonensis]